MYTIILFSGLAGILGTSLGGVIGLFLGKKSTKTVSMVLTFASGIMISVALFDLMPEAYEIGGLYLTIFGVLLGVLVINALNYIIDKFAKKSRVKIKTHSTIEQLKQQENKLTLNKIDSKKMLRAGLIMLLAISLHNIPEGVAIGSSGVVSMNLSITLAILLALHNIPEGMAISVPLTAGNVSKIKTLSLIALAGATTILGGAFGVIIGGLGSVGTTLSLAFAAGAMLYVTFCEILPQSALMKQGRLPALFTVLGILTGFFITAVI